MKRMISWPPGIGWLPVGVALIALLLVSTYSLMPQFGTRILGSVGGGSGAGGPATSDASGNNGTSTLHSGRAGSQGLSSGTGGRGSISCAPGKNGGATDTGVTATEIHIATTAVTSGIAKDFLGESVDGMLGAINRANSSGGVCGRRVVLDPGAGDVVNTDWNRANGENAISNFIHSHKYFALVGEPDSEGLAGAIDGGRIDQLPGEAPIPVVGTDGMLTDQYHNEWVWPVAASTVSNMHIGVNYASQKLGAHKFGIVYDSNYKFGKEGAVAFAAQVSRVGGTGGTVDSNRTCGSAYCGFDPTANPSYSTMTNAFESYCGPNSPGGTCDVVMMLLEPGPMLQWMNAEGGSHDWYKSLMGGEPLFDHRVGVDCGSCGGLTVWTGFRPPSGSFSAEKAVADYAQSLPSQDDPNNEFTEGAYLGTEMFIEACRRLGQQGIPLTRVNLKHELDTDTFDLGLSIPLVYNSRLPHLSNIAMAGFKDNASGGAGTFHAWVYENTGFLIDPAPGKEQ
jgi:ABC-type branched-subunit amino acid transport system substrate-binding protein